MIHRQRLDIFYREFEKREKSTGKYLYTCTYVQNKNGEDRIGRIATKRTVLPPSRRKRLEPYQLAFTIEPSQQPRTRYQFSLLRGGTKRRDDAKSQQETFIFGEQDWRRGIYTRNDPRKSKTRRDETNSPSLNVFRERRSYLSSGTMMDDLR